MIGIPIDASKIKVAFFRGGFKGLVACAEDLLARSIADAPVDESTLRQSARIAYIVGGQRFEGENAASAAEAFGVAAIKAGGSPRAEAEVSFNTVYAAAQHEAIAFMVRHDTGTPYIWQAHKYPGGGGPKFLERNVIGQGARYQKIIAASAQAGLKPGGRG